MKQGRAGSERLASVGRWAALGAAVLAAGWIYSCRAGAGNGAEAAAFVEAEASAEGDGSQGAESELLAGAVQENGLGAAQGAAPDLGGDGSTDPGGAGRPEAGGSGISDPQGIGASDPGGSETLGGGAGTLADGGPGATGAGTVPSSAAETLPSCWVYVCGEVNCPGVYEMEAGQRLFEAVELAGGFTEEAASDYLNLAEPVGDGMKIQVPDREEAQDPAWIGHRANGRTAGTGTGTGAGAGVGTGAGTDPGPRKVNLNTATKEELMTLTGIGESRAEDILRYRSEQGAFTCIEDIMNVSGIKEGAFAKIKDQIEV